MEIAASIRGSPLSLKGSVLQTESGCHTVKRRFDEASDFPLPPDNHSQHTGHDPSDGDGLIFLTQIVRDSVGIPQGKGAGKVDSHQIILFCPEERSGSQIVIGGYILCLADPTENFLLRLGVNPHSLLASGSRNLSHHRHQAVDILSLPPGVRADIDGIHILPVQKPLHNVKLFFDTSDYLIFKFPRQKRQCIEGPPPVFLVIFFRIAHGYQVPHAPGNHTAVGFQIAVHPPEIFMQRLPEFLRHGGLFCNV